MLAVAATVPVTVLLLILAIVIVIVAGVCYWARLRHKQHDHFRHVAMSQVDNEDC